MAAGVPVFARVGRDLYPGIDLDEWPHLRIVERAAPEEIADAIAALLRHTDEREAVVRDQAAFVGRHFRAEVVAGQYLELFASLTDANPLPLGSPDVTTAPAAPAAGRPGGRDWRCSSSRGSSSPR